MRYQITVQIEGEDVLAGTLFVNARRGLETASFSYAESYLQSNDAFALSPDLPLVAGAQHASGSRLFGAFEDCMPDRWGRNLLLREERRTARLESRTARTLLESDFLVGVSDLTRQGAIRVWEDGEAVAPAGEGVPREASIPSLLKAADLAVNDMEADVRDLLAAGSSLGGARPKASVVDEKGKLCIAKFPKADETPLEDVCAWEHVVQLIAAASGMDAPRTRALRVGGRCVLLLERFDRRNGQRVPYISGMSAVQGADGGSYSYLELVDFLEREGSSPERDSQELWRRILLSCAVGNTDDHMRNQGLLRDERGWRLSPVFDVNPTPGDNPKFLSCAIDFDRQDAEPACAMDLCELFRVSRGDARAYAAKLAQELARWERLAMRDGISRQSVERMRSCFESGTKKLQAASRGR